MPESKSVAPLLAAFCVLLLAIAFAISSLGAAKVDVDKAAGTGSFSGDIFASPEESVAPCADDEACEEK